MLKFNVKTTASGYKRLETCDNGKMLRTGREILKSSRQVSEPLFPFEQEFWIIVTAAKVSS